MEPQIRKLQLSPKSVPSAATLSTKLLTLTGPKTTSTSTTTTTTTTTSTEVWLIRFQEFCFLVKMEPRNRKLQIVPQVCPQRSHSIDEAAYADESKNYFPLHYYNHNCHNHQGKADPFPGISFYSKNGTTEP